MVDDYDRLDERIANIQALEKRGDQIDREVNRKLEDAFITPFDREDIHELVSRLDDVVDGIQADGRDVRDLRGRAAPPTRPSLSGSSPARRSSCWRRCGSWTGQGPRRHLATVHDLEHEADGLSRAAIARLFPCGRCRLRGHQVARPLQPLEETIDAAEDAAEVMERIVHKPLRRALRRRSAQAGRRNP